MLCCIVLLTGSSALRADDGEYTFRVLGLFQQDREDDLRKVTAGLPGIELVKADYQTGHATFRFDAEQQFRKQKAEQLPQTLSTLLRTNSRGTFEATALTGRDRKKLTRIEIDIVGLDCKGCSYGAYLAVYKLDGVENATASFKQGKVVAWVDSKIADRADLVEALKKKRVKLAGESNARLR